jgi:hypothetical protein
MRRALALLLLAGCASQTPPPAPAIAIPADCAAVSQKTLCAELLAMRDADQAARKKLLADRDNPAIQQEVERTDQANLARVIAILDSSGWPGKSAVGEKGSGAAWIILQHSDPAARKRYLPMMESAVAAGELSGALLATTVDRIRINDGLPQLYGSQFREENGKMVPFPIENEAEVDARRAKVGLGPLAEYSKMLNEVYARPKSP